MTISKTPANVAIYARYSTDKQSETSIKDQIRRCLEYAVQKGLSVDKPLIYTDEAVSGTDKGDAQRDGYRLMRADWQAGLFTVLITDEFSRLSRDPLEQAKLQKDLDKSRLVRLITPDGIDTYDNDWQLRVGLDSLLAQQEIRRICHRVKRGMSGQLERGYMVAVAPFGYDIRFEYGDQGQKIGTRWQINESQAAIVKQIFERRANGESMHQIALWLNGSGIPCSRAPRKNGGGYWRAARVRGLLCNSIYRGVFTWHNSTPYVYEMRKKGQSVNPEEFPRPHLRIVSDEIWHKCNPKTTTRKSYGGNKHALSGLLSCGHCGSNLVVSTGRARSLYCAVCTIAKGCANETTRQSSSIAADGVQELIMEALKVFISPQLMHAFKKDLEDLLTGDRRMELQECETQLKKLAATQERLSRMIATADCDDEQLEKRYEEVRDNVRQTEKRLREIGATVRQVNVKAVQAQLQVDPKRLLSSIFDTHVPPEHLGAVLRRLFPSIVFNGRVDRRRARFTVHFAPGVALADASDTPVLSTSLMSAKFELRYQTGHPNGIRAQWYVSVAEPITPVMQTQSECTSAGEKPGHAAGVQSTSTD